MTATDTPGGRRELRRLDRALMFTGHYALWVLLAYAAVAVASDASGQPGWLTWPAAILASAWIASFAADVSYHDSHLCERCIAATPLDTQKAVDRWRPALWLFHRKRLYIGTLLAMIAWTFISVITFPGHPWWMNITDAIVIVILVITGVITWTHRRLYPWCPWCNWGKGGDEEQVPDPDPEDHGVKPVPA